MKWVKEHFFMSFIFSANYKAQTLKTHKKKPKYFFHKEKRENWRKNIDSFFPNFLINSRKRLRSRIFIKFASIKILTKHSSSSFCLTLAFWWELDAWSLVDWVKSVPIQSYFWSVFSCIRTEYRDLLCKSPYSVLIQKNMDQK